MIYKLALVFHLIGLILLAGSTFFSFINLKKISGSKNSMTTELNNNVSMATLGFGLGMLLFLLSGITMISIANAFASQIWFRLKMGAVVLIIINNLAVGRPATKQLLDGNRNAPAVLQKLSIFYYAQLFILAAILVLSSFKFN